MNKHTPGPYERSDKPCSARLIAAAPDLLHWLKAVLRQMEYERPQAESTYTNGKTGLFGMKENLEKAIAKAEKGEWLPVIELRPAGQCGQCKRDLMEPFEVGAHGDKYCVGCYRYLTQEDV